MMNLNVGINSNKYDFLIKNEDVEVPVVEVPFSARLSCVYTNDLDIANLQITDEVAASSVGSKIKYKARLNPLTKTVKIYVPNEWLTNLYVKAEEGSIFVKNMKLNQVNATLVKGNMSIIKSSCSELEAKGNVTKFNLVNTVGKTCNFYTMCGNINIDGNEISDIQAKTETGNIRVMNQTAGLITVNIKTISTILSGYPLLHDTDRSVKCLTLIAPHGKITGNVI